MSTEVVVSDVVRAKTDSRVQVTIGSDKYTAREDNDQQHVSVNDSYQVVPYAKRVTVDYDIPEALVNGFITDIDDIRGDLLDEVAGRKIALIDEAHYRETYVDGIQEQIYATIKASYIGNVDAEAYVLRSEIANMQIEYDSGSGYTTATFQDLNDAVVAVGNSQAGYTENLEILVASTNAGFAAWSQKTDTLEAAAEGLAASIEDTAGVFAGTVHTWDGSEPIRIGYTYDFGDARGTVQYLGGTLGDNNDGWVTYSNTVINVIDGKLDDTIDIANTAHTWAAGASKLITNTETGAVTGWSFGDGSLGSSVFKINADNFVLAAASGDANWANSFTVVSGIGEGTPNMIKFNGEVEFSTVIGGEDAILEAIDNASAESLAVSGIAPSYGTTGLLDLPRDVATASTTILPGKGMSYPVFSTMAGVDSEYVITLKVRSDSSHADGLYIKVYESNLYQLPDGKTHIGESSSNEVVEEKDNISVYSLNNIAVSSEWATYTVRFRRTNTTFRLACVAVVSGTGIGTDNLYVRDYSIVSDSSVGLTTLNYTKLNPADAAWAVNNGTTTISGSMVRTGLIVSEDSTTWIDLTHNQIRMHNELNHFTLDSTAAGTSAAPNIQGGYIKGATIEGTNFIGQDIIKWKKFLDTSAYNSGSTFSAIKTQFDIENDSEIDIMVDTVYLATADESSSNHAYSDKFHVQLKVNGAVIFASVPNRVMDPDTESFDDYTSTSVIPTGCSISTNVPAGTVYIEWECVEDDPAGDDLNFEFSRRYMLVTIKRQTDIEVIYQH